MTTSGRRPTSWRSGFRAGGERSGREGELHKTKILQSENSKLGIRIVESAMPYPLFEDPVALLAVGLYARSNNNCNITITISCDKQCESRIFKIREKWTPVGIDIEVPVSDKTSKFTISIDIESQDPLQIEYFGFNYGFIDAYDSKSVEENFGEDAFIKYKINKRLYTPITYYFDNFDDNFLPIACDLGSTFESESYTVFKFCNRCSLPHPIDIGDEYNPLGFSRHARFKLIKILELDDEMRQFLDQNGDFDYFKDILKTDRGFQLECRSCKKFKVNARGNPRRTSAQRREDSSRRRAIESLILELIGDEWIYYKFRQEHSGREFDTHILEKFKNKCFRCNDDLTLETVNIDHTMPLVFLWPLDETATALCSTCNSEKSSKFPKKFYDDLELSRLSILTGLSLETLNQNDIINELVINRIIERINWFFEEFLAKDDYQKIKDKKKVADLIVASINNSLRRAGRVENLIEIYKTKNSRLPTTILPSSVAAFDVDQLIFEDE